MGISYKTKK